MSIRQIHALSKSSVFNSWSGRWWWIVDVVTEIASVNVPATVRPVARMTVVATEIEETRAWAEAVAAAATVTGRNGANETGPKSHETRGTRSRTPGQARGHLMTKTGEETNESQITSSIFIKEKNHSLSWQNFIVQCMTGLFFHLQCLVNFLG